MASMVHLCAPVMVCFFSDTAVACLLRSRCDAIVDGKEGVVASVGRFCVFRL